MTATHAAEDAAAGALTRLLAAEDAGEDTRLARVAWVAAYRRLQAALGTPDEAFRRMARLQAELEEADR